MDEAKYTVLLKALKACEKNYHSHVREFGKLDKTDIAPTLKILDVAFSTESPSIQK